MACLYLHNNKINTNITSYEIKEKITFFIINIKIGEVEWIVKHRYNDFVELHDLLVKEHSIAKDILPAKKLLGNMDPTFIEKRKTDLEIYLQNTVKFLEKSLPKQLIDFLHINKYDVNYLVQDFSEFCFDNGDDYLTKSNFSFSFNPLQLHAITKRLQQECPVEESLNQKHNFSHILEFCNNMVILIVQGSPSYIGTSNVTYNELPFELTIFKKVQKLFMYNVSLDMVNCLGTLRSTIESLICISSSIKNIGDILLCDEIHKNIIDSDKHTWKLLNELDISKNEISKMDDTLNLVPNVEKLNLESNQIENISNLNNLTKLKVLNLNRNCLRDLNYFYINKPFLNLEEVNLCENRITNNLIGLNKLSNLKKLDLSSNYIFDLTEIECISSLQQLNCLTLTGNPIATIIDYRLKILQLFYSRVHHIVLDNEKPTIKEIDCAGILNALCIAQKQMIGQS